VADETPAAEAHGCDVAAETRGASMTALATLTDKPVITGTWALDPVHSGIYFKVRHLGVTNVRGRFNEFSGALTVGEELEDLSVEATVDMASVDTNQPDRDAHLRTTDFFNVDNHPTMVFRSTAIRARGDDEYELEGNLTINGVTKPLVLDVEFNGTNVFPADGSTRAGFTATGTVRRKDYGVEFGLPTGVDQVGIANKVHVELDLQFVAPTSTSAG
jgi:polyisoprenoid-binding protein YceI